MCRDSIELQDTYRPQAVYSIYATRLLITTFSLFTVDLIEAFDATTTK